MAYSSLDFQVDTAESLAVKIIRNPTLSSIPVRGIGNISFDIQMGAAKYQEVDNEGIKNTFSPETIHKFERLVEDAIKVVAKFHLLKHLDSLRDERISKHIRDHHIDFNNIERVNLSSVNLVLRQIQQPARLRFFSQKPNAKHKAIARAIGQVEKITNMQKVNEIWDKIQSVSCMPLHHHHK